MILFPAPNRSPLRALGVRFLAATALVAIVVVVVYADRGGYQDVAGHKNLSLLDSAYYSVVSLTTTGYGDITPVTPRARLVNLIVLTPARVLFLVILVGTTLEVLTEQYRRNARLSRWRTHLKDHVIVCGYGTKGSSAVRALKENGLDPGKIVVVEEREAAVRQAAADGLVAVQGSATRSSVLTEARIRLAKAIIIATDTDEAAVLVTLTARQLTAGQVRIVAAVREAENAPLLRQSGAHQVVVSSATAGRLLGLSTSAPPLIDVVEDLLTAGHGMALALRSATRAEVGRSPREVAEVVIALVRRGQVVNLAQPEGAVVETGDTLVYVRNEQPSTPVTPQR
ncbi:potassium channel family protein [Rhizomonospora bruguierae]|uniref:potassium channel family protein n=1 Tax=Rhizomonospora bruguierae TaxID=1581705 RepID=UPI001BCDB627|nr:potassium channel family protein [Micromonospora sp. NBRC 107566]